MSRCPLDDGISVIIDVNVDVVIFILFSWLGVLDDSSGLVHTRCIRICIHVENISHLFSFRHVFDCVSGISVMLLFFLLLLRSYYTIFSFHSSIFFPRSVHIIHIYIFFFWFFIKNFLFFTVKCSAVDVYVLLLSISSGVLCVAFVFVFLYFESFISRTTTNR